MTKKSSILVTCGTQFPFERLMVMVAGWAVKNPAVTDEIYCQVGPGGKSVEPIPSSEFLTPEEYNKIITQADVLVAHAGIGSILSAYEKNIPIIIMPRKSDLGEHRNNHQASTSREFSARKGVYVANSEKELHHLLDVRKALDKPGSTLPECLMVNKIRSFIKGN